MAEEDEVWAVPEEQEGLASVTEAARLAGISPSRVYRWITLGKLPAQQGKYGKLVSATAVRALAQTAPSYRTITIPLASLQESVSASDLRDLESAMPRALQRQMAPFLESITIGERVLAPVRRALDSATTGAMAAAQETLRTVDWPRLTQPLRESVTQVLDALAASLASLDLTVAQTLLEQPWLQELARRHHVSEAFKSADLLPAPSMTRELITEVVTAHEAGANRDDICVLVSAHYEANHCYALAVLVDHLCASEDLADRAPVLRDTLAAHRMGLDTITTYPLVAMIEGVMVMRLSGLKESKVKHNHIATILSEMPYSVARVVSIESMASLIAFLENRLFSSFDWQTEPERRHNYVDLNRHCLLHGMTTQGTRMNTLRCFLILDVLAVLLPTLRTLPDAAP